MKNRSKVLTGVLIMLAATTAFQQWSLGAQQRYIEATAGRLEGMLIFREQQNEISPHLAKMRKPLTDEEIREWTKYREPIPVV